MDAFANSFILIKPSGVGACQRPIDCRRMYTMTFQDLMRCIKDVSDQSNACSKACQTPQTYTGWMRCMPKATYDSKSVQTSTLSCDKEVQFRLELDKSDKGSQVGFQTASSETGVQCLIKNPTLDSGTQSNNPATCDKEIQHSASQKDQDVQFNMEPFQAAKGIQFTPDVVVSCTQTSVPLEDRGVQSSPAVSAKSAQTSLVLSDKESQITPEAVPKYMQTMNVGFKDESTQTIKTRAAQLTTDDIQNILENAIAESESDRNIIIGESQHVPTIQRESDKYFTQNTSSDYSLHFTASASSSSTMRSYPDLETEEEFEIPQSKRQCNWDEIERGLLDTNDYIRDQMQDTWTSSRQSIKSRSFGKPDSGESSPENRAMSDARFMINMRRNERVAKQNEGLRRNNDPMMVSWNTTDQRDNNTDGGANYFWNSKQHRPFEF